MTDTDGAGADEVTVRPRPAERSVPAGEKTTVELVVEGADRGVSAFESGVSVGAGAHVESVELTGDPAVPVVDIGDDGTSASVAAAMGPESDHVAAKTIVVAAVTVSGETPGTSVEFSVDEDTEVAPISDGIEQYTVGDCGTATLSVTGTTNG
jgi:hypothetical protein